MFSYKRVCIVVFGVWIYQTVIYPHKVFPTPKQLIRKTITKILLCWFACSHRTWLYRRKIIKPNEACHVLSSFENLVEKFVEKEDIFYPKMRFNGVFCKSMLTRIISLWMLLTHVFIVYPVCILLVKEKKQRHNITIRINFIFFSFITSLKKDGAGQSAPLIL